MADSGLEQIVDVLKAHSLDTSPGGISDETYTFFAGAILGQEPSKVSCAHEMYELVYRAAVSTFEYGISSESHKVIDEKISGRINSLIKKDKTFNYSQLVKEETKNVPTVRLYSVGCRASSNHPPVGYAGQKEQYWPIAQVLCELYKIN